jgi:hypothetical protein
MARFANLHDAGRALASHIRRNIAPALTDVLAAPPMENAAAAGEALRVSLLWVTPQPTHRNDPWITGDDGQSRPPPLSLSAFYAVTAYGTAQTGEPTQAINRLGQALQVLETAPVIEMPLSDDPVSPAIDPVPGSGRMTAVLVPVAADLMEKIFTPLQIRHRPWALVELGPVQLERLLQPQRGPDVVAPGGVRLTGPRPISPPVIRAISPARAAPGRRLRLDTVQAGEATVLRIGAEEFVFADAPTGPGEIARPDSQGRVFVTYPAAGAFGEVDVVLTVQNAASDPFQLTLASSLPGLDAPLVPLAPGSDLALTGTGLATSDRLFLWPDRGIQAPAEVIDIAPSAIAAGQLSVSRSGLATAGLRAIPYRVAARIGRNRFTPFVVVEVVP